MLKKTFLALAFLGIFPFIANASNAVSYHCPTIDEASNSFDIRTTSNNKDVNWKLKDTGIIRGKDKPVEFIRATLSQRDNETFDMEVTCEYKTQTNRKFIVYPTESYFFCVDGLARKLEGHKWTSTSDGTYTCTKSILDCGFLFS